MGPQGVGGGKEAGRGVEPEGVGRQGGGAGQGMGRGRTRDGAGPEGVERQGGKLGEEWTSLSAGRGWEGGL